MLSRYIFAISISVCISITFVLIDDTQKKIEIDSSESKIDFIQTDANRLWTVVLEDSDQPIELKSSHFVIRKAHSKRKYKGRRKHKTPDANQGNQLFCSL